MLHIQCLLMFLIDFFLLNSNPMNASLKNLGIFFFNLLSKVNFNVKYDSQQMKRGTSVIPQLHVILTGLSIYKIILII